MRVFLFDAAALRSRDTLASLAAESQWYARIPWPPRETFQGTEECSMEALVQHVNNLEADGRSLWLEEQIVNTIKPDLLYESNVDLHNGRQGNPTILPDDLFWSLTPLLVIQNPAVLIPSLLRDQATKDLSRIHSTCRLARLVFDAYCHRRRCRGSKDKTGMPIILDVARTSSAATFKMLRQRLGMNPERRISDLSLCSTSSSTPTVVSEEGRARSSSKLFRRKRVDSGTATAESEMNALDLEAAAQRWTAEFGERASKELLRRVEDDLVHYIYLKQFELGI